MEACGLLTGNDYEEVWIAMVEETMDVYREKESSKMAWTKPGPIIPEWKPEKP